MKHWITAFIALFCVALTACQRPVAYFQRTPYAPAARLTTPTEPVTAKASGSVTGSDPISDVVPDAVGPVLVVSVNERAVSEADGQIRQHTYRISRLLNSVAGEEIRTIDQQPKPKPKPKMRLGNRIRDALGMPIRQELNWWQRISWKLKASVIIILVAVLFAILHVTILAIIFGIVGAFLLISGLRRSFKVRRPWF